MEINPDGNVAQNPQGESVRKESQLTSDCPDCPESLGYTPEYLALYRRVGPLVWDRSSGNNDRYKQITTFLCGQRPRGSIGHDSLDAYKATEKLGILAGLPDDWATCKTCGGDGEIPQSRLNRKACDNVQS